MIGTTTSTHGGEARFTGPMLGHTGHSTWVDRSMMLNGLKPMTTGPSSSRRAPWQATLADQAGTGFDALPERLRVTRRVFGIDAADGEIMRSSVDPGGFITPMSIANGGGEVRYLKPGADGPLVDAELLAEEKALRHREVAEKLPSSRRPGRSGRRPGARPTR